MKPNGNVPRIALTRTESARSLGMGLTLFKEEVLPHLRVVRVRSKPVIPVTELERWVQENTEPPMNDQLGEDKS